MSTPNKAFSAGLIGAGYISEYHIAALRRLPNVQLIGICDLDASRAAARARQAGVPAFTSLATLCDAGADVIHVLTPPDSHADIAVAALNLGCHVFVEKPLAVDVEDCARIEQAATHAGAQVCVGHSMLFDPQVRKALASVRRGTIGRVISVDIFRSSIYPPYPGGPLPPQYRTAGYPFRDLGVHALYLLEAFLGPIGDVNAQWSSLGGDPNLAFDEWRAQVRCQDGTGQVQLSWNVRPLQNQIIIQGTKGVLRVDVFLMFQSRRAATRLPKPAERVLNAMTDSLKPMLDVTRGICGFARGKILPYHGLQELIAGFYRSLSQGAPVPVSVADATRVVKWTEQVARAADTERHGRVNRLSLSAQVPVLVTGASGAVGSEIVQRLRERGTRVRIFVRRMPSEIPDGVEVAMGNLGDPEAVDRAVRGARLVINAGAATRGGWIEHECATVVGTRNILESCRKRGVEKLVHISSLSVVQWADQQDRPISEITPLEPCPLDRGAYTQAKLEAERLVVQMCRDHNLPAVILRPGQIFGGRIPLLTPAVARVVGGRFLVLGDGEARLPLIYMDDVVDGILAAADSPLRDGQVIHLVDDLTLTQNEVLAMATRGRGKIVHIPRGLLMIFGRMSEGMLALARRRSPLSAYRLQSALAHLRFESDQARKLLGWSPRVGVNAGIRRMLGRTTVEALSSDVDEGIAESVGGLAP